MQTGAKRMCQIAASRDHLRGIDDKKPSLAMVQKAGRVDITHYVCVRTYHS